MFQDQPLLADLVASCRPEFTSNDLKRMELVVLDKLQWQVPSTSSVSMLHNVLGFASVELCLSSCQRDELIEVITPRFASCMISYELLRFQV